MTAAREQAREAVEASLRYDVIAWHSQAVDPAGDAADAASDVWEPLLRELVDLVPYASSVDGVTMSVAYQRAKEALGDRP